MIYLLLAEGFEEVEALAAADVLRRGEREVTLVGITGKEVRGAHNITVHADIASDEWDYTDADCVILPGGMPGTLNLQKNEKVQACLNYCVQNQKLIAAICAAPMILGEAGLLEGKNATCFPGFEDTLEGATHSDEGVVRDGNIITARGAGVALEFGAEILNVLTGSEKGDKVLRQMQVPQR